MRHPLHFLCITSWWPVIAFGCLAGSALAQTPPSSLSLPSQGTLSTSIQNAGDYTDGNLSLMLPLHSSLGADGTYGGTLLFASPYGQWFDNHSQAYGLSLGFRHLFSDQALNTPVPGRVGLLDEGIYLGADVSLDYAEMAWDAQFAQLGMGAEIGTRYLSLRGRYHLPLDNGVETHTRSTQTYNVSNTQRLSGGARLVTNGTVRVQSTLTMLTESMSGWEVAADFLVPGLDQWMDVNLTAGYARYHSDTHHDFVMDSWRFGVEARPVPAVVLAASYFENERLYGENWLFSIGFELPFETADIGDGKGGFWGHIKDAFKPRRRHLSERLIEPIRKHSLPMQFDTIPSKLDTQVTAIARSAIVILADGTVIRLRGDQTAYTTTSSSSFSGASALWWDASLFSSATSAFGPATPITATEGTGQTSSGSDTTSPSSDTPSPATNTTP